MTYILDASAGVEIALNRACAQSMVQELSGASKIVTTELYKAETTNVLWKYHRAGLLSKDESLRTLEYCGRLIDEFVDLSAYAEESLVEAIRLGHSAYDLFYLTLARRCGGVLVTMDKRLKTLALEQGVAVFS